MTEVSWKLVEIVFPRIPLEITFFSQASWGNATVGPFLQFSMR